MKHKTKEELTLIDRAAVAFLSGVFGFVSAVIVWGLLIAAFDFEGAYIFSSFKLVIYFAILMAALGFIMLENFIANVFGHIWHGIYNHIKE